MSLELKSDLSAQIGIQGKLDLLDITVVERKLTVESEVGQLCNAIGQPNGALYKTLGEKGKMLFSVEANMFGVLTATISLYGKVRVSAICMCFMAFSLF